MPALVGRSDAKGRRFFCNMGGRRAMPKAAAMKAKKHVTKAAKKNAHVKASVVFISSLCCL